jgi:hypothetical protein
MKINNVRDRNPSPMTDTQQAVADHPGMYFTYVSRILNEGQGEPKIIDVTANRYRISDNPIS